MKIKRVEHIAIAVDSLRQSIDLLRNTFGLALEYEEQIGQTRLAMLPVGETYLELLEGRAHRLHRPVRHRQRSDRAGGAAGRVVTWGAPIWPPTPPNARSAQALPGRSSTIAL